MPWYNNIYFRRNSELAQRAKELIEIQSTIKKLECTAACINLDGINKQEKDPFVFEGDPEESSARTRPMSSRVTRKIIKLKFDDNQDVSKTHFNTTARKYAPCSLNINSFTQLQDVNPDFIIQDIMGMRAYQYGSNPNPL